MSLFHNRFVSVNIDTNNDNHDGQDKTCTVCFSNMDDNITTTLRCGHKYHTDCYTSYIAYNLVHKKETITCPICRGSILEITVNKPEALHIVAGENDIESQSSTNELDYETQEGCCKPGPLCTRLIKLMMMIGSIYFVTHITLYCTHSHTC